MRYKAIEYTVEAFKWLGDTNTHLEVEWFREAYICDMLSVGYDDYDNPILYIESDSGILIARVGDYIVRTIYGRIVPIKEFEFNDTYREVHSR